MNPKEDSQYRAVVLKQNEVKRKHVRKIQGAMVDNIASMDLVDTGEMFRKLRTSNRYRYGELVKTAFRMPKHAIMMEHGAGRGYGGPKGSTWTSPSGERMSTNPSSKGKAGTPPRHERPWFSQAMDAHFPALANELSSESADEMARSADPFNNARKTMNYRINM